MDLENRIRELESELKVIRTASLQWEEIQRTYQRSNDRLQDLQKELTQVNERLSKAFEASQLVLWEWDFRSGSIRYNENMGILTGIKEEQLPSNWSAHINLIHQEDRDEVGRLMEDYLDGHSLMFEAEYRLKTAPGGWKWFHDRGGVVEKDILGKPLRLTGILMDVENKKIHEHKLSEAFEKANASNKAKSLFLANMSHEIYTPLSGVVGMAEILKQSVLTPEQKDYLQVIVDSATNLLSVFNTIMDYLKIEADKIEFTNEVFSVYDLMEEIIGVIVPEAGQKGLQLLSFVDPNIPLQLKGDPSKLKQIIRIFADNAVKYTDSGEITISAFFGEWDDEKVKLEFTIADTGIGIHEESIKKLFTSFTIIAPSVGKYGGSGLGLAIAKYLIGKMKGDVHVESVPGKGSVFSFHVCLERVYPSSQFIAGPEVEGLKVLLIDPLPARAKLMTDQLTRFGCESEHLLTLTEGEQFLAHAQKIRKHIDLVFVELEATTGVAGTFRSNPAWEQIPKILVCYVSSIIPEDLDRMNFNCRLIRPFIPSDLVSAMIRAKTTEITQPASVESQTAPLRPEGKKLRILLAEDNLINQKVAKVTLSKLGHEIDVAETGKQAVDLWKNNNYDLILMDIYMPEMDGLQAAREIRKAEATDPSRQAVLICAITANTEREEEEKCFQAGIDSFITKPFRLGELMEVLDKIR